MERKEIEINKHKVVIMEQPASFVISLDKKYGTLDLIGYVKEVLKYPSGVNKDITELFDIPSEIKYKELSFKLSENKENALYEMLGIFNSINHNGELNGVLVAETFLNKINKNIDEFKYKELEEIGFEVFNQVKEMAYLRIIVNTFRSF
ncbi:MAG: hypothetical protein SOY60_06960 [Fusobacterium gastrosuis]|uniref:hypothetical protein n=1 Tax=Fusobacterium gastrosuis TaxID=1755100 RepID=UPI002A8A14B9|nr:hypothetical protein [Fusobacterium gastrosuis]